MTRLLVNARMYSVTPECKAAWQAIIDWVLNEAGVSARYENHDPPKLLSDLWRRDDLACAQMCGLPFSLRDPQPIVLAAAVPSAPRYGGKPVYWSDIAVRVDSPFKSLEETFGMRAGYTLKDSQSGYFAFRHHLLRKRAPQPYREIVGNLLNPRGVIKALAEDRIDAGPLDSYVHDLLKQNDPGFASQVRVIERTDPTPMPPLVTTAPLPEESVRRLRDAFLAVHHEPVLAAARATLLLGRFIVPDPSVYSVQRERAEEVERCPETWP
jgi:ABC-type phosphate/phosphonate transport system substrate-binding protein